MVSGESGGESGSGSDSDVVIVVSSKTATRKRKRRVVSYKEDDSDEEGGGDDDEEEEEEENDDDDVYQVRNVGASSGSDFEPDDEDEDEDEWVPSTPTRKKKRSASPKKATAAKKRKTSSRPASPKKTKPKPKPKPKKKTAAAAAAAAGSSSSSSATAPPSPSKVKPVFAATVPGGTPLTLAKNALGSGQDDCVLMEIEDASIDLVNSAGQVGVFRVNPEFDDEEQPIQRLPRDAVTLDLLGSVYQGSVLHTPSVMLVRAKADQVSIEAVTDRVVRLHRVSKFGDAEVITSKSAMNE